MPYSTPIDIAAWPGALECAQACTPKHLPIPSADVMDALLRGNAPPVGATAPHIASATAALANLNAALAKADRRIDAVLQVAGYSLPLSPVPTLLQEISLDITRFLMHADLRINSKINSEGQHPIHAAYERAEKYLEQIQNRTISLGADDPAPPTSTSGAAYFAGETRYWKRSSRGLSDG